MDDTGSHPLGDLGRPVSRIAIDDQDLRNEIKREIVQNPADGLRFVARRNDDGHSH
jgi:hypothetical protein